LSAIVYGIKVPISLQYQYSAGRARSRFLRAIAERRIIGERCPECHQVYAPPTGACPIDGVPTDEEVEVSPEGTVTTFCIVNLPFYGQQIQPPYVCASIKLDGADTTLFHLIQEVPADEVRMGMRVEAVWAEDMDTSVECIRYFRPTGAPDAQAGRNGEAH
jgi:uncharacterized OB-fold protein